jgi:hypothetical protein
MVRSVFFILYIQYNHASIVCRSHGVGLLNVQTLLLHHRLHPPLNPTGHPPINQTGQCKVRLSCSVEMLEKPQLDLIILDLLLASSTSWLTSLKVVLFSRLVLEDGCLWWLEPVQRPLSMCPPTFPFLGTEVLACECNLNVYASKNRVAIYKHEQQDET